MSKKTYLAVLVMILLVASVFGTVLVTSVGSVEIEDWHDLNEVRDDLDGDYVLVNDLDESTDGYEEFNTRTEDHEAEVDAGFDETWDDGDMIDIQFADEDYDSVLSVEDRDGNLKDYNVEEDTIIIEEDTGERYLLVTYENALVGWEPIGGPDYLTRFKGTFDGNGHEIIDLYIDRPGKDHIGLFGRVDAEAEITDVGIDGAEVNGERYVGLLVGENDGNIRNSYATGEVKGDRFVGGLVGLHDRGLLENSHSAGQVEGNRAIGGFVGAISSDGEVSASYATSKVSGYNRVGGLVGINEDGIVRNSYATGDVDGDETVGGLVGYNNEQLVENSYAVGQVTGDDEVGGLIGYNSEEAEVRDSFWDIESSVIEESDGGTGKSTTEMKNVSTYTDTSTEGLEVPWDFVGDHYDDEGDGDIWDIDDEINDGYPFLVMEEDEEDDSIPGFTSTLLLLGMVFAAVIYSKKKPS